MIISALPLVPPPICPILGPISTICQAASNIGSTVVNAGANDVLSAFSSWVVDGATWLLGQIGGVLTSSTAIDLGASWFGGHYHLMAGVAAVVVLPLLLGAVLQAVFRQDPGILVRSALVQLPLALVLTAVAVQIVQLALGATDALSSAVAAGTGADLQSALTNLSTVLSGLSVGGAAVPAFIVLLGALLVVIASLLLWVELLVRAAAVYAAVLFLPLALASLVWPTVAHWCRRLVDTLVALVLSKFVIVAILSLALSAVGSGAGQSISSVLAGGALLLLAAFSPFTLLRLLPMVEAGAVSHLEGARHRVQQSFGSLPRTAASFALNRLTPLPSLGPVGTGLGAALEAPGGADGSGSTSDPGGSRAPTNRSVAGAWSDAIPGELGGLPSWRGEEPVPIPLPPGSPGRALGGQVHSLGPPPLLGEAGSEPGPGTTAPVVPSSPPSIGGIGGTHVIGRDRLGPVIRWNPALLAHGPRTGTDADS
jgi:hypothetical protein